MSSPQQNVTAALAAAPYSDTSQSIVNAKVAALLQNMAPAPPLPPVGKYVKIQDLARRVPSKPSRTAGFRMTTMSRPTVGTADDAALWPAGIYHALYLRNGTFLSSCHISCLVYENGTFFIWKLEARLGGVCSYASLLLRPALWRLHTS